MLYSVTACTDLSSWYTQARYSTYSHETHTACLCWQSQNSYTINGIRCRSLILNFTHTVKTWRPDRNSFMSLSTPVTAPIFTKLTIMQYSLWTSPVPYFTQTRKNRRQLGQYFYYISKKRMAFTAVIVTITKHTIPNQHCMETFTRIGQDRQSVSTNSSSPLSKDWLTELLSWYLIIFRRRLLYYSD